MYQQQGENIASDCFREKNFSPVSSVRANKNNLYRFIKCESADFASVIDETSEFSL